MGCCLACNIPKTVRYIRSLIWANLCCYRQQLPYHLYANAYKFVGDRNCEQATIRVYPVLRLSSFSVYLFAVTHMDHSGRVVHLIHHARIFETKIRWMDIQYTMCDKVFEQIYSEQVRMQCFWCVLRRAYFSIRCQMAPTFSFILNVVKV